MSEYERPGSAQKAEREETAADLEVPEGQADDVTGGKVDANSNDVAVEKIDIAHEGF
jgi:hypothetical protein